MHAPRRWAGVTLTSALVVLAGGCGKDEPDEVEVLRNRAFLLKSAEGFQPAPSKIELSFAETRVDFFAGCNRLSGTYEESGAVLSIRYLDGVSTVGCGKPWSPQEDWLVDFLTSRPRMTVVSNDLTLRGPTATLVFLDSAHRAGRTVAVGVVRVLTRSQRRRRRSTASRQPTFAADGRDHRAAHQRRDAEREQRDLRPRTDPHGGTAFDSCCPGREPGAK